MAASNDEKNDVKENESPCKYFRVESENGMWYTIMRKVVLSCNQHILRD